MQLHNTFCSSKMANNIFLIIFLCYACIMKVRSSEKNSPDASSFEMQLKNLEDRFNEQKILMEARMDQQDNLIHELKQETFELKKIINLNNLSAKNYFPGTAVDLKNISIEERIIHLEEVAKTKLLRTCDELEQHGVHISGFYHLDPDGELIGHPPIRAYCDMENHVTEILHNADDEQITIDHCESEHCFNKQLIYSAPMEQMTSLIELSSQCDQIIEFDCYLTPLSVNDVNLGVWTDRKGDEQIYYYGKNYNNHVCSCSASGNCTGQEIFHNKCNCDNTADAEWMEDSGRITNKTALPITGFIYGPLMYEMQEAKVRIGRLRCGGRVEVSIPSHSCGDLKKLGETREGLYAIQDEDNSNYPKMSYCKMNKPGYGEDLETESHWMKRSSGPGEVLFAVQHSGTNDIAEDAFIVFDKEVVNVGGSINVATGVFTALIPGKYQFSLNGLTDGGTGHVCIDIYLNGVHYLRWYEQNAYGPNGISRVWIMNLNIGDTLRLKKAYSGGLLGDGHALEFNGYLM